MLKIFNLFVVTNAFKLLQNYTPPNKLLLKPCPEINPSILMTTRDVCKALRETGLVDVKMSDFGDTLICSQKAGHYGSFFPIENEIWLNDILEHFPKMSYNIILHELLHRVGLDHSEEAGMMGTYAVRENSYGFPIEDQHYLWLSFDDVKGLFFIKYINL